MDAPIVIPDDNPEPVQDDQPADSELSADPSQTATTSDPGGSADSATHPDIIEITDETAPNVPTSEAQIVTEPEEPDDLSEAAASSNPIGITEILDSGDETVSPEGAESLNTSLEAKNGSEPPEMIEESEPEEAVEPEEPEEPVNPKESLVKPEGSVVDAEPEAEEPVAEIEEPVVEPRKLKSVTKAESIVPESNQIEEELEKSIGSESSEYPDPASVNGVSPKEKPIKIPSHLIGHNLEKPVEAVKNGRLTAKPRLGVKVPNKNLTSQIVSKQDITNVVMERSRQRKAATEITRDLMFTRKLTSRLANKLLCGSIQEPATIPPTVVAPSTERIANNSDLIALLEGDDDDDDVDDWNADSKKDSNWEREVALKQLQELPRLGKKEADDEPRFSINQATKTYTRKRKPSEDIKAILDAAKKPALVQTVTAPLKPTGQTPSAKAISLKVVSETPPKAKEAKSVKATPSPKKSLSIQKSIQNIRNLPAVLPPNVKLSSDKKAIIIMSSPPKQSKPPTPNTYISKSSRVVKRKKIWDPDEATPAKVKSPKPNDSEKVVKTEKPVEKTVKPPAKPAPVAKTPKETEKDEAAKPESVKKSGKKPGRTEIDRLLGDEGAVNLLYSIRNSDATSKGKKNVSGRELLNRTNKIKSELLQNNTPERESPIALRKKAGAAPAAKPPTFKDPGILNLHRKKSKDSAEGGQTPPASPAYSYETVSRIIRRHSSSSFTAGESDDDETLRNDDASIEETPPQESSQSEGDDDDDSPYDEFATFNVRTIDNLVQIILVSVLSNDSVTLNPKALAELTEVLELLKDDDACRVVVVSSAGSSFCLGIDYKELVAGSAKERNAVAKEYANSVREFLITLSKFPKPIVAGVHGSAVGLGVTMLPLFDMVLASDTATFSTQYARLGCAAEGGGLLTLPHVMHTSLASELFFASKKLTAAEALRLGLVTRTLWPDKFQDELLSALKVISSQSLQGMQAIKKQLRYQLWADAEAILKREANLLVKHWTSAKCQKKFASYVPDSK